MPFTHHSHSGQFCPGHARNTLSEMLNKAIDRRMIVFAMTEHIPRGELDLYPEEVSSGGGAELQRNHYEGFVVEARKLQRDQDEKLARGERACKVLVGMEGEWIRLGESAAIAQDLIQRHTLDFMVGSVHHVQTIPIDYNQEFYERARRQAGGTDRSLFLAYFDAQLEMLETLKPLVVGHFDLIRLYSDASDDDLKNLGGDMEVWDQICRNLNVIKGYGGVLEINSSALRKGLKQPYPRREICKEWMDMGGTFVMSDDSHGIEQVGTCYDQVKAFLQDIGLQELGYLERSETGMTVVKKLPWEQVERQAFWTSSA